MALVFELFGSANVDGYDELETLDANNDGRIDAQQFCLQPASRVARSQLRWSVHHPRNADACSLGSRLSTCRTRKSTKTCREIFSRASEAMFRSDSTTRSMGSVQFELEEMLPAIPANADISDLVVLPNLSGDRGLPNLRTAMYFDANLRQMVEDLTFNNHDFDTFAEFRDGGFLDVIYCWAGVDTSIPLGPGDLPYNLQALEAFTGLPLDNLNTAQLNRVENFWDSFLGRLSAQFLVQAAISVNVAILRVGHGDRITRSQSTGFEAALSPLFDDALSAEYLGRPGVRFLECL